MGVTLVIRAEEWLSSVPLHHQLFDALGFARIPYAHVAPLMKQDGSVAQEALQAQGPRGERQLLHRRRLSRPRRCTYYLRGLANARLAELPLPEALAEPLRLAEFGVAGPLLDMAKLDDVSADFVATLSGAEILERVLPWADAYDKDLAAVLRADRELALRALRIERVDTDNPRKDLRKWSEFRAGVRVLLPVDLRAGDRPGRRAVRRPRRRSWCARWRPGSRPATWRRARTWPGSSRSAPWRGRSGSR